MYRHLGAHLDLVNGVDGTRFAVWAPNAREISVLCDRTGKVSLMRLDDDNAQLRAVYQLEFPADAMTVLADGTLVMLGAGRLWAYTINSAFGRGCVCSLGAALTMSRSQTGRTARDTRAA